jgi:hypothetical protein
LSLDWRTESLGGPKFLTEITVICIMHLSPRNDPVWARLGRNSRTPTYPLQFVFNSRYRLSFLKIIRRAGY